MLRLITQVFCGNIYTEEVARQSAEEGADTNFILNSVFESFATSLTFGSVLYTALRFGMICDLLIVSCFHMYHMELSLKLCA